MRIILYLISYLLLLPSVLFAAYYIALGRAISEGGVFGFAYRLVMDADWVLRIGLCAVGIVLLALLAAGLFVSSRWLAALFIVAFYTASAAVLSVGGSELYTFARSIFVLPGAISPCIAAWLAIAEWPRAARAAPDA